MYALEHTHGMHVNESAARGREKPNQSGAKLCVDDGVKWVPLCGHFVRN